MAKYVKGESGNPNGRPTGTENRTTKETRKLLVDLLSGQLAQIPDLLDKVTDPEKKLNLIIRLLPYFVPKLESETFREFDSKFQWGE